MSSLHLMHPVQNSFMHNTCMHNTLLLAPVCAQLHSRRSTKHQARMTPPVPNHRVTGARTRTLQQDTLSALAAAVAAATAQTPGQH